MKSVVIERRLRRLAVGATCASVIFGFIACSGSSERRSSRQGAGGDDSAAGSSPAAGQHSGGSSAQGGESSAGEPGLAGRGGDGGGAPGTGVGEAGTAGQDGVAGEGSGGVGGEGVGGAAGESSGGQSFGGEAGAGGSGGEGGSGDFIDPVCGLNLVQVGAYSLWCGKVNMHKTAQGTWIHDADCSSGCNVTGVGYCKKFYPNATAVVAVNQAASGIKDWKNAGCADSSPDTAGISGEAACCAPLP